MNKPVFDIVLAPSPRDCSFAVNGVDITSSIRSVTVQSGASQLTEVTLGLAYGAARTVVTGAFERDQIAVLDFTTTAAPVHPETLGAEKEIG